MTDAALVPYEARALERIEFSPAQIQTLKNTICRGATDAELQLFTYACQDIGLNPFLHQIWAIQRNVKVKDERGADKWEKQLTIQVGIDGYRVIRDRLRDAAGMPLFQGMDGPQWSEDGKDWSDYPETDKPKFARVAVYRRGIERPFVAIARWSAYVQDSPMWGKMGAEQLAKCAEALAYRRAFPADMSGLPVGPVAEYPGDADTPEHVRPGAVEGEVVTPPPAAPTAAPLPPAPTDLLNLIKERQGKEAQQSALAVLPRLFGTGFVTKLSHDQRAEYAAILRFRLEHASHDCEVAYAPSGLPVCRLCGEELAEPAAAPEPEPEPEAPSAHGGDSWQAVTASLPLD